MTKMKSKKMTKSTFAIIIMAVVMVAMLAFGGTYAYFTAQAHSETDTVTTGKILLKNSPITLVETTVVPKMNILAENSSVAVDVTGTTADSYVFVKVTASVAGTTEDVLTISQEDGWTLVDGQTDVYYATATTGDTTIDFTKSIVFDADNNYIDGEFDDASSENGNVEGVEITVTLQSVAIQSYSFADAKTAYAEVASMFLGAKA